MLAKFFFRGLAVILPVGLTVYILYWTVVTTEHALGGLVRLVVPKDYYWEGLGIAASVVLVLIVGILMYTVVARWIYERISRLLERIPLVKSVYGMLADVVRMFGAADDRTFSQVVMVRIPDAELELVGFITREHFDDLPDGVGGEGLVAVFLPMSYQLGGFVAMVPRERVRPVDMGREEALRFVVTAGVSGTAASSAAK